LNTQQIFGKKFLRFFDKRLFRLRNSETSNRGDLPLKISSVFKRVMFGKDVFVSYPKSGRTWMRYVLRLSGVDMRYVHAGSGHGLPEIGEDFNGVNQSILSWKNVFMHRNPLDTAVSMYFETHFRSLHSSSERYSEKFNKLQNLNRLPPEQIEDFVLDSVWGIERVCKFNRDWLNFVQSTDRYRFHVISYEAANLHPEIEINNLLAFLGSRVKNIDEIVQKTKFDEMKKLESALSEPVGKLRLGMQVPGEPESMKVRKGKIGGYRDYLSDHIIEQCAKIASSYDFKV